MNTILIFEPLSGGHRANFIGWLKAAASEYSGCRFVFFSADEAGDLHLESAGWLEKQKRLYKLFRQACRKYNPDHVLILELTHLELLLALFGSPVPLSAILFVQYPELPRGLKFFFKQWKTALLLLRVPLKNLFLLNGKESCRYLQQRFGTRARFIPIPDPAPDITPDPQFRLRDVYDIAPDRKVFLFFGAISPRKGTDVLLDALHQLASDAAARSAFVFCGAAEARYQNDFHQACEKLRSARPDIFLCMDEHFVSNERMMALFEQTDVILMPYLRPEYSSGILALAAKARTPVIGPEGGLVGRLIRQNGLGAVCPITPEAFAEAIAEATRQLPFVDELRCRSFVEESRPERFGRLILDAIA